VYQQRFCAGVDFRASTAVQNAVAFVPALVLALSTPVEVHNLPHAVLAVAGVVLLNATLGVSLYVRAIGLHGAASVAMLFCVIPAVAGVLSWLMLGERMNLGIAAGLVLGALACWLNASGASRSQGVERSEGGSGSQSGQQRQDDPADHRGRQHRVDAVHDPAVAG
jgi:drug/metabolite transporter (DMT)-like permease